ncbi:hypothetical protein BGZ92_008659 [Podila epicladia]|nr:hypothetical protein BGZ92_008659 [Podila epicladia]
MVNKSFPRYESENGSRSGSFPGNGFEQRLLLTLGKVGFDQEIFSKSVPAQSCDPGYGLWCLLVDQVRQRAIDNGTSVDWEQSVSLVDMTTITGIGATSGHPNGALIMMESGKKSPRPMSDPSPTSSQTNLLLPQVMHYQPSPPSLQQQELEQQTTELKAQLDQYKLETELLKVQKQQLEKEMSQLTQIRPQPEVKTHPFETKELPPITAAAVASAEAHGAKPDRVQDSGVSVSTSSTPNSSWEIAEREAAMATMERPRRKSKGILHSIKDRLFSSGNNSDTEGSHSNAPSPVPTRHMGQPGSASSSTSSAITFAAPKPLPAPPAHPYPYMAQLPSTHSPLSAVSYKSASTSSLAMESGHATSPSSGYNAALSSDHLALHDSETSAPHKKGSFRTWITESAQGTVLNKAPVVQSNAKVPKRLNARSFSTADPFPKTSTSSSEEVRPQIPAIPASFFQPIWKLGGHASSPPSSSSSGLASSAPGLSIRQRLASFSSSTSAKISPEERQRAAAAAAAAAALVADPSPAQRIAVPERAHSPSPPSSPRGSDMHSLSHLVAAHENQDQNEINDIVAAAVAATASAHLQSSTSRKKNLGLSSGSKKSKASSEKNKSSKKLSSHVPLEHYGRSVTEPASKASPSLQIPSTMTSSSTSTSSKDSSKGHSRKPSIKSSKATMPSLMTAFSPFKASKSAPSSPNVHRTVQLPDPNLDYHINNMSGYKESKYSGRHDEPSNVSRVMSNSGSSKMTATTQTSIKTSKLPSLPSSPALPKQISEASAPTTFGDGVIVQDEPIRTKKRTTSRTSITAASLGRKSSDSVSSAMIAAAAAASTASESVSAHPDGATTPTSAVPPSKRASLTSLSSRRSSSSSMRDRNIYGLTLDSGSGSRKSSLNLTRVPLSKSTFHSPSSSPGQPRRGGEMDRPLHSRGSEDRIRASTSIREEGEFEGPPLESLRRHSRESSSHNNKSSRPLENYPTHAPSPTLQPRSSLTTGSISEEPTADGVAGSASSVSGINAITISPSLSTSSSLNRVTASDKEDIPKVPEVHVDDIAGPISFDTTGAPRINFEDGCSLIPSPPPSPAPIHPESVRSVAPVAVPVSSSTSSKHLEEPKASFLSTSFPPPRNSLSYNDSASADLGISPSPPRPLVSFDQHFANQSKIKEYRDSTTPRKVVNGFQPLAAKRLSKPGLPNSTSPTPGSSQDSVPPTPSNEDTLGPINRFSSNLSSSFSNTGMMGSNGPPNAFAGRRRGYRNSTGSMANMTLQQQQNFQQLQQEQLLKIQQSQQQRQQFTPNAGYEATAAMKMNPRPRTGYFPKREFGGVALGGLGGQNASPGVSSSMGPSGLGNQSPGFGGFDDVGGSGKRDSYSSRRQSMATAMGKRAGAAPAAIQEEEE